MTIEITRLDNSWVVTIDGAVTSYGDDVGEALLAITKAMESVTPSASDA